MHTTSITAVFSTALLALASAQTTTEPITGIRGNASVVENNPIGKVYIATLPEKPWFNPTNPKGNVKGSIAATANPNGVGVRFTVNFENLPTSGGPFLYHIHDAPVPADGNCSKTLAHQDPYIRGQTPPCNAELPQTCEIGDLSGKHGSIASDPFHGSYSDDFASTLPGIGAYFGNRSFVIHYANLTRISCANFTLVSSNETAPPASYPTGTIPPISSGPPLQFTGGANAASASLLSLTAVFGLFFVL